MPHLISNLYEKNYTPFTAKLAPRNLWNRPVLGKFRIYKNSFDYPYREKATKDIQNWTKLNLEGYMEIH